MTILEEAENIINGDREKAYGKYTDSFGSSSKIWSGILRREVTPQEVVLCMIGLKLQRESNAHGRDNLVDMVGYILILEKLNATIPTPKKNNKRR